MVVLPPYDLSAGAVECRHAALGFVEAKNLVF
jgi:hypothetical protein